MTIRLATTPAVADTPFTTFAALAAHIHAWRRGRGLSLKYAMLYRDGRQDPAVSVYAADDDDERSDQLGYVVTGEPSDVLMQRLLREVDRAADEAGSGLLRSA